MTDDNIYTSYKMEQPIYATWPKERNIWGVNNITILSSSPPKPPLPPMLPPKLQLPPPLPPSRPIPPVIYREKKPLSLMPTFKNGFIERHY